MAGELNMPPMRNPESAVPTGRKDFQWTLPDTGVSGLYPMSFRDHGTFPRVTFGK
jgi:hypothetical protein